MLNEVLDTIQEISSKRARIRCVQSQRGDMQHTMADTTLAGRELGYRPQVELKDGLKAQWDWLHAFYR
jgi:nucleoside-diphosphate-sugar epimerase